jgi:hypothetical protein
MQKVRESRGGCEHGRRPEAGPISRRAHKGMSISLPAEGEIEDRWKDWELSLFCPFVTDGHCFASACKVTRVVVRGLTPTTTTCWILCLIIVFFCHSDAYNDGRCSLFFIAATSPVPGQCASTCDSFACTCSCARSVLA